MHFMESESSLPHSQVLATCPYRSPDHAPPLHVLKIQFNIIFQLCLLLLKWYISLRVHTIRFNISLTVHDCTIMYVKTTA